MPEIFISYVHANEAKIRRLYEDLTRCGLSVWEFRTRQKYDENFVTEFKRQIEASRVFLLADTNEARRGEYVQVEVAYAREIGKRLSIGRFEECISEAPLYEEQEVIIRFDLWDEEYRRGIRELCRHLGKEYIPAFTEPIDDDFSKEMVAIDMKREQFKTGQWRELWDKYEEFRDMGDTAPELIKVVILRSKALKVPLLTPYLVLGDYYARKGEDKLAKAVYEEAAGYYLSDPRTFAGVAGANYFLKDFGAAAAGYLICYQLLQNTTNENHRKQTGMIAHNLLLSILQSANPVDYLDRIDEVIGAVGKEVVPEARAHFLALKGKYFYLKKDFPAAVPLLERAYYQLRMGAEVASLTDAVYLSVLMLELATAYGQCGGYSLMSWVLQDGKKLMEEDWRALTDPGLRRNYPELLRLQGNAALNGEGDFLRAIAAYKAAAAAGDDVKFEAELAMLYQKFCLGGLRNALDKAYPREKSIHSSEQQYYMGLVHYLDHNWETARNYYRISGLKDWPYYSELIA